MERTTELNSLHSDAGKYQINYQSINTSEHADFINGDDSETKKEDNNSSKGQNISWTQLFLILGLVFLIARVITAHDLVPFVGKHEFADDALGDDDTMRNPSSTFNRNSAYLDSHAISASGLEGVSLSEMHLRVDESTTSKKQYQCFLGDADTPLASGSVEANVEKQGWNYLSVRSELLPTTEFPLEKEKSRPNRRVSSLYRGNRRRTATKTSSEDVLKSYWQSRFAMGFIEGSATCKYIQDWYSNSYQAQFDGGDPTEGVLRFLESNHDWMVTQSELHWRSSDYWFSIKSRLEQLHGMLAGIRSGCPGTDDAFGGSAPLLPANKKRMLQDLDGHRDWEGQSGVSHDLVNYYTSSKKRSKSDTIYLASMTRQPSLVHLLIHNANGDLYQIGDKFNIFADKPNKKTGRRKDQKRPDNKKYMLKNHTHFAQDDDAEDDDGDRSRWGREMLEIESEEEVEEDTVTLSGTTHLSSSRSRRANILQLKRSLLRMDDSDSGDFEHDSQSYHSSDHCSALVKILPNNSDVVFGHNTWDDYQNAFPRIFKTYEYPVLRGSQFVGMHKVDFSSSPGLLASIDDFYIVKGSNGVNMGVIETSIDIYNRTYLDYIKPESVLAWMRAVTANEMATSGAEWANRFSEFASGTYIDQWMVLDFNRFEPSKEPLPGFFTVLEEVPSRIHWEDMTRHLINQSYWASYNNPYFTDIRDISGQTDLCIKNSFECYTTDPRAQIFRGLQGNITSVLDLRRVMQYNHWQTDVLSMNDSCRSIACRADLEVDLALWGPHGAVDAKVSSYTLSSTTSKPVVWAKLGPTHDTQPPFCWEQFKGVTDLSGEDIHHEGHPKCFEFDWLVMPR